MLPLPLDLAPLNLRFIGMGDACLRATGAGHATVRRLTAAQIDRYGCLKQQSIAAPANDRGVDIKEPTGGGVS